MLIPSSSSFFLLPHEMFNPSSNRRSPANSPSSSVQQQQHDRVPSIPSSSSFFLLPHEMFNPNSSMRSPDTSASSSVLQQQQHDRVPSIPSSSSFFPLPHEMFNLSSSRRSPATLPSSSVLQQQQHHRVPSIPSSSSFLLLSHEMFNPSSSRRSPATLPSSSVLQQQQHHRVPMSSTMSCSFRPQLCYLSHEIFNPRSTPAQVSLCLQVEHLVDGDDNITRTRQLMDLHNLLAFPAAEEAVATMLSNSKTIFNTDTSKYSKLLRRLLSAFVHQAAVAAAARNTEIEAEATEASLTCISLRIKPPAASNKKEMMTETAASAESSDLRELLPETCPVCMNDYTFSDGEEIISTPSCFHVFHKECISEWFHQGGRRCPLCRELIISN